MRAKFALFPVNGILPATRPSSVRFADSFPQMGKPFFLSHPTRDATFFIFPIRYNKLCNNFCNGGIPNYAANS